MRSGLHMLTLLLDRVWLQWSNSTIPFDFSWKNLLFGPGEHVLKFVLNASVNWEKTPDLLKLWGYTHQDLCSICSSGGCTLQHILSKCSVVLRQRRYNWHHDSVLKHILTALADHIGSLVSVRSSPSDYKVAFVRAGPSVRLKVCLTVHLTGEYRLILIRCNSVFLLRSVVLVKDQI